MIEVALATGTAPSQWEGEDLRTMTTVLELLEERARARGKG